MLKKLSEKIGFTQTEIKVTLLLLVILILGFSYKTFFRDTGLTSYKKFDYAKDDSTFLCTGTVKDPAESQQSGDDKDNVLELNKKNTNKFPAKIIASEKSVNLNTAGIDALITIPGVGKKTADRIIELRTKLGRFKNFDNLLKVKNISDIRLAKIKKYAYIK
jgi:competence ComEA-like helix-hairpin-helix protein